MANHDVVWGYHRVREVYSPRNGLIQHILAQGIGHIYDIVTAKTYQEKVKLLCVEGVGGCICPKSYNGFLSSALCSMSENFKDSEGMSERILQASPFFDDGDLGAQQVHDISLADNATEIYGNRDWANRRWGYVLWDGMRLRELGAVDSDFLDALRNRLQYTHGESQRVSWNIRRDIFLAGGRGRWDPDDLSQVRWPNRGRMLDSSNVVE